jgi:hypothetical protein
MTVIDLGKGINSNICMVLTRQKLDRLTTTLHIGIAVSVITSYLVFKDIFSHL